MTRPVLAVLGLGQIGGSVTASVKARDLPWRVRAWDRRGAGLAYAEAHGLVDEVAGSVAEAVDGAALILLAAPVRGIRDLLGDIAPVVEPGQIVTDTGSTKASIVEAARERLPAGVAFVGAHPVAGTERSGVEAAAPRLFEGRPCVLTPEADTPDAAVARVATFWQDLGARVVQLDPREHDRVFALVSHLPHVAAYSLVATALRGLPSQEAALAGPSFRDLTRVTESSPALWRDVCLENRDALLAALDALVEQLRAVRGALVRGDGEALEVFFHEARLGRRRLWIE